MIKIERLIKEDIPQVVLLEEELLGDSLGVEMLENEINNTSICFLTAKDNKKVLGYIGAYVIEGEMEILNFVVDKAHQRSGIGTLLFNELLKRYPNTLSIILEVRENNEQGINFYKKNNFNVISKRKHYYKNGDDALVMMKEII
ncbi:MAG: ribosomal-protein-alanine N-acetyltransferase [Erysipelotrichaceae bacterium]|nr:ribosomal-protein-alanine N-acetyltransferase [Erysipelotrichaceae bacterium]MBQ4570613.1 ribosomal protein S18-alanine N-acetyltransferase [Bacilli bacterium]